MLPSHGKLDCRLCFEDTDSDIRLPHPKWKMVNDPGHWGSATPEYLVLGFSKGATQAAAFKTAPHEKVAFANMRPRLEQALKVIGVMNDSESITDKIEHPGSNIAFASLVRCSLSRVDEKATRDIGTEQYASSGNLIIKSFSEIPTVISRCTETFLTGLPDTLKAIFLLGCSEGYVREVKQIIRSLYPETYQDLNAMAASADGKLWVFIAHASPANGTFNQWLSGTGVAGEKARLAKDAVIGSGMSPIYDKNHSPPHKTTVGVNSINNRAIETKLKAEPSKPTEAVPTRLVQPEKTRSRRKAMGFTPEQAKEILDRVLLKRAQTDKLVTYDTPSGKNIAMQIDVRGVQVWIEHEPKKDPRDIGLAVRNDKFPGMPYSLNQGRNSNLNNKNAPNLKKGNQVWYLTIDDSGELDRLLDWYAY